MILKCSEEGCAEVFKTDQPVSSSAKYTCRTHQVVKKIDIGFQFGATSNVYEAAFQRHQFDRRLTGSNHLDLSSVDLSPETIDLLVRGSFQVNQPQVHDLVIPEWSKDDKEIQKMLLRSFPKLQSDEVQRQRASRWARVIYLHYRMCWTHSQIAMEMGLTELQIRRIVHSIRRVSSGRRADGKGLLSGRRGRPKKHATL